MGTTVNQFSRVITIGMWVISSIGAPVFAQVNDDFADALALPNTVSVSISGSNVGATAELDEPNHAGYLTETSVWWMWTAPSSGYVEISTIGSDFDTLLAVYTGTTLSSLNNLASNDDADDGFYSHVQFSAVLGTTYQIAVAGHAGDEGNIELNIGSIAPPPPSNDDFADRIALPSLLPFSTTGNNVSGNG